jgi:hypothetical protein
MSDTDSAAYAAAVLAIVKRDIVQHVVRPLSFPLPAHVSLVIILTRPLRLLLRRRF